MSLEVVMLRVCRVSMMVVLSVLALGLRVASAQSIRYVYDALGRLISVTDTGGYTAVYHYDAVGNITAIDRYASSQVSIIAFSPTSGPVGTTVTISGTGFSATPSQNTVSFNGTNATVSSASATQLVVTVPTGATTGTIGATAPAGSATSATAFTVGATAGAPTITSFTPTMGASGTSVTVTGTNFQTTVSNDRVLFNNLGGTTITSATATSLATAVPPVAASGHISVATPAGTAISSADFFVPPTPYTASDVVSTGRVALGSSISVPVGTANKIGLVVFDGTAGHRVSLKIVPGPLSAVTMYKPNGAFLASASVGALTTLIEPQTLGTTGTYAINVDPTGTATGTTTLTPYDVPADVSGTLTPTQGGSSVSAGLSTPGQNALYTLGTPTNTRVSLNIAAGPLGTVYVRNADGSTLTSGGINAVATFVEPWTFAAGQTIKADPNSANTGTVTLTAYDVPADLTGTLTPTLAGSSVSPQLSSPGQNGVYTLGTPTNARVSLKISGGPSGTVYVRNADGSTLTSGGIGIFAGFVEPWTFASGQTLKVDPNGVNTGTVTVTAYDVPADGTGSMTIGGGAVTVTTTGPGQNARRTFSGTVSQPVVVHITNNNSGLGSVTVKLLDTNGSTVLTSTTSSATNFNLSSVTLPSTGTYTVLIDPPSWNIGSLNVSVTSP
jgi:YD repeat-containing protein